MSEAFLILADYAQVQAGKLHLIGGGINLVGPGRFQMGVAVIGTLPWNDRSKRQTLKFALYDADKRPVTIPSPIGVSPLEVGAGIESIPAPGTPPGSDLTYSFAFNIAGIDLPAGSYTWMVFLNDAKAALAQSTFAVRSPGAVIAT